MKKSKYDRSTRKGQDELCLDLWKIACKLRDEYVCQRPDCPYCGNVPLVKGLQVHHIFPRTDYGLRHNEDNGLTICASSHKFWLHTDDPKIYEFEILPFLKKETKYSEMVKRAKKIKKLDYEKIENLLLQKCLIIFDVNHGELIKKDSVELIRFEKRWVKGLRNECY